jgi:oligopeptide transport system substrate-binding protein
MANGEMVDLLMVSLYGWKPSESRDRAELVPRMALGEPRTEDGYTWIINLNPQAVWANGEPINAHTFIYSWKMGLDPNLAYTSHAPVIAAGRIVILNAEAYFEQNLQGRDAVGWDEVGMKALDEHTLEITTARKYSVYDVMLHFAHRATAPVYEPLYSAGLNAAGTSTLYGTSLEFFMGNGPYTLTSWTMGSERIFVRNENYLFADEIKLDGIYGRVAAEEITRLELFANGQSDYIDLGVTGLLRYIEDPRLVTFDHQRVWSIEANRGNPDKPILDDPLFRRALYYATDRRAVANLVNGTPAPYYLSTIGIAFDDGTAFRAANEANDWLPPNYGFDPVLAKELLLEAFEKYNINSITLTLAYGENMPGLRAASELIQFQWQQVFGSDVFTLNLRAMPHNAVLALMRSSVSAPNGDWDLGWSALIPRSETFAPYTKFSQYLSNHPNRYTNYSNDFLDAMFPLFNEDEYLWNELLRFELTRELERHFIMEDVTLIPVYQEKAFVMFSSRVRLPLDVQSPILGFGWEFGDIVD